MQFAAKSQSALDGLFHPPRALDIHLPDSLAAVADSLVNFHKRNAFASEPDEQHGAHIGVGSQADQGLGDPVHIGLQLGATLVVEKGSGILEFPGDLPGHLVGAKNRGNDGQIVPRPDLTGAARIPEKMVFHGP